MPLNPTDRDRAFTDSVSRVYESHLVPLIFEPYGNLMAARLASIRPSRVLEVAAGTGVLTRAMASLLPSSASITSTDLNPAMLSQAASVGTSRPVEWRQADAQQLPFADATFDAVVCQFGVMFFPDKPKAFAEARRVLTPGGVFLFSVWDRIEDNEFADEVTSALASVFPTDPPRFLRRTPHGYFERDKIETDLARGGFTARADLTTVAERSRAASAEVPAIAYCHGTPLRNEIEAHGPSRLAEATAVATGALARRFGGGIVDGKIQAHIAMVDKRTGKT
jgi:SAM-dependent methyltransferase